MSATDNESKTARRIPRWAKILFFCIFNPLVALAIAAAAILPPWINAYKDTLGAEPVYTNVFVAALGDKQERLASIEEPKLAVVGGSSVAFGLDSELLGRYTDMEVVNFGLYATLGSKIMLDLSEGEMKAGDVVVFAPELDSTTLSMYFGADAMWQAIDATPSLRELVRPEDRGTLYGDAFDRYRENKAELLEMGAPNPSGVYNRKNFNEYGDISYKRPYNTMAAGYDTNTLFNLSESLLDDEAMELISYFNGYCERLSAKGVKVYFSFCPINELAMADGISPESISALEERLRAELACPVISSLEDYVMDWGYFFDTNLHLNDAGVKVRTAMLIDDIRAALGMTAAPRLTLPDPPGKEIGNELLDGDNRYMDYFTYENVTLPDGTVVGVKIVGVTDEALENTDSHVVIPHSNGEYLVVEVGRGVLSRIPNLKEISFGRKIASIEDGVFEGCESLTDVYFEFSPDECGVSIPDADNPLGLMTGAKEGITLHATEEYHQTFVGHYTWSHYAKYFKK